MRDRFRQAGLATPELDARLLAERAFDVGRLELVNRERDPAPPEGLDRLSAFAARRLTGEPVARILGEREFWGLSFRLNEATLVPRPETERLVELGLVHLAGRDNARLLDLGTGTGCIPIAMLTERPDLSAVGVDLSDSALAMARQNAERLGVASRFDARRGSWFDPVMDDETFDLIVSNPPYIDSAVIGGLMPEVRDYDPRLALDGGADGLSAYRIIVAEARRFLQPSGMLAVEIGSGQGAAVIQLLVAAGLAEVSVHRDIAGRDRVVSGRNPAGP